MRCGTAARHCCAAGPKRQRQNSSDAGLALGAYGCAGGSARVGDAACDLEMLLVAAAAAGSACTAAAHGRRAFARGTVAIGLSAGAEDRKLKRAALARAFRTRSGGLAREYQPLVVAAAILADVFVYRHRKKRLHSRQNGRRRQPARFTAISIGLCDLTRRWVFAGS